MKIKLKIYLKRWFAHPVKRRIAKIYLVVLRILFATKVIGITGSVGKTTTKEMVAAVLSQKGETVASFANIDPVYNIPTTILKTTPKTRFLVLEMGVEYPGEMDFYLWLAKPDIGVLTNIYWTHTEFLQDLDGVFKEKSGLINKLPINGWAILNTDDERVKKLKNQTQARVLLYGTEGDAFIRASKIRLTKEFKTVFELSIGDVSTEIVLHALGNHFVTSALAAAAVGYTQNIPIHLIKIGIERVKPVLHRMIPVKTKSDALILDDTYNSNPLGAKAAIDTLVEIGIHKRKIAVLGDMLELGEYAEQGHREVGNWAAKRGVDLLLCMGEFANFLAEGAREGGMSDERIVLVPSHEEARKFIKSIISPKTVILFKASRKLGFEKLVNDCRRF